MKPVLTGLLILALFAADAWALLTHEGRAVDVATYHVIHDTYRAPWLDKGMQAATMLGDTKTGVYSLAFFAFFGTIPAQVTAKLAAVSLIGAGGDTAATKWVVDRERPERPQSHRNSAFPSPPSVGR